MLAVTKKLEDKSLFLCLIKFQTQKTLLQMMSSIT